MRLPTKPPSSPDIPFNLLISPPEVVEGFIVKAIEEAWNWDDCRYRAVQTGIAAEQLWTLIKIRRQNSSQKIGLADSFSRPFVYMTPPSALRLLSEIDQGLAGTVATDLSDVAKPDYRARYVISSLQEEAFSSSLIEGAVATRVQAKELIRKDRTPTSKSEWMILNNYRTIRFLNDRRNDALTPELLLEVQRRLTENTLDDPDEGGRYRTADEVVTVCAEETGDTLHTPPPAGELPQRILAMCKFANATKESDPYIHPVIRAVLLHFWLAYDHPFVDGNGRTARALFYWHMLRNGYWLAEFLSISSIIATQPKQYYRAFLDTEIDENDATYFVVYHLKVLQRSLVALQEYLRRKKREQDELAMFLGSEFNPRQRDLLQHAVKNPVAIFSYKSHASSHDVTLATARADLLDLVDRGALVQNTRGRQFEFTPHPDIIARLTKKKKPRRKS